MTCSYRTQATLAQGGRFMALGLAVGLAALSLPKSAAAEVGSESAKSGAKGTIGGALLGAELVLAVEAAFDVKPWWGYAIGGGLGAIGGGIGGFFVDQQNEPTASMSFLVAGLVLAVPTTIAVLSATAYEPEQNPVLEPAPAEAAASRPRGPVAEVAPLTPSLATVQGSALRLSMPAIEVRYVAHAAERALAFGPALAAPTETSVHVPVFGLSF
jgi:hypothetical protein